MAEPADDLQSTAAGLSLEEGVPLAEKTTLGVGGPARYLARCATPGDLRAGLALARGHRLDTFILGGGSNLLVADAGFDGLVLQLDDDNLAFETEASGDVLVRAGAGVDWDRLVAATVDAGLGGLECLSGIPGRAGAAPIQNIGAYGQEAAETVATVHAIDRATGRGQSFAARDCGFGYRQSHFKGAWSGRYAVVQVDFRLRRRGAGTVRYRDLRRHFGDATPTLREVRDAVLEIRRSKSMVIDPDDPNRMSAGSFFMNPVVTPEAAESVRRHFDADDMPAFPTSDSRRKLSAAWLIERSGFHRSQRLGRAAISSRHCLALVNTGGASASEIVALARLVRQGVHGACGVTLRPEPIFLGFDDGVDVLLE